MFLVIVVVLLLLFAISILPYLNILAADEF